jgi:molecular chaperone DnaK
MWQDLESLMPGPGDTLDEPTSTEGAIGLSLGAALPPEKGQREAVQARALLEKADRIRAKASVDDQPELDRLIGAVKAALAERNWDSLETASNELTDVLFYLEDA